MPTDLLFYLAAIPAVVLTGVSKSGFGGIALLAVPLMSLVMSPVEAAAIMLPLLLLMDLFGVLAWRGQANWRHLGVLLPGAAVGVLVGMFTASYVAEDFIRLLVGVIAVGFCAYRWWPRRVRDADAHLEKPPHPSGVFWGAVAGYTSYVAHAGSPPYHAYILPKNLDKKTFAATGVWFFALVNLAKLPAYMYAGQLTANSLYLSLILAPLVPVGFWLGLWLNRVVPHAIFYRVIYAAVFLSGLKLIGDVLVW